jgi:hypothetical protein
MTHGWTDGSKILHLHNFVAWGIIKIKVWKNDSCNSLRDITQSKVLQHVQVQWKSNVMCKYSETSNIHVLHVSNFCWISSSIAEKSPEN